MIFEQFYLNCLAHASYLVGDRSSRTAVIVDPQRDIQRYLDAADRHGLQVRHVFLTHFHADFVAGHLELRDRTGARIHLGSRAEAEYAFAPMHDGEALDFGRVRLRVLETPGHTVESISILVYDLEKDESSPQIVLTGDTLFVGDVGRPDLRASLGWSATELGRMLYQSLTSRILTLPDATLVYPAHGAGSLCGKSISKDTFSTIGDQRRLNYALQPMSEDQFLRIVTADQPDAPPYFAYDAVLNTRERPTLDRALARELEPLDLSTVLVKMQQGAQTLDVREASEFANAHLAGSLNIGLDGQYATWAGTLLDRTKPVVLVAQPGREREAALRLGRIGFDIVDGYLRDGILALDGHPERTDDIARMLPDDIAPLLSLPQPPLVLDVRTPREWAQKHIPDSVNIPLNRLAERIDELPSGRTIVVNCAGGYRSMIAASILQQHRFTELLELAGGFAAWEAAGRPIAGSAVPPRV
jgi:glyoxylase-like metal-dependent hydrolase (beta-lactamase superfamily II)/rhodanese-related sulfurtransferase